MTGKQLHFNETWYTDYFDLMGFLFSKRFASYVLLSLVEKMLYVLCIATKSKSRRLVVYGFFYTKKKKMTTSLCSK